MMVLGDELGETCVQVFSDRETPAGHPDPTSEMVVLGDQWGETYM